MPLIQKLVSIKISMRYERFLIIVLINFCQKTSLKAIFAREKILQWVTVSPFTIGYFVSIALVFVNGRLYPEQGLDSQKNISLFYSFLFNLITDDK